ncbi:pyridoxamine 5'-phosphate oxidase family protein [Roseovarius sp. CAU 1744]|uniref:FAD-binding oxidoreductase n=1 Tax=Roseovarius sp. CAU 1744 TaxID=3140368 RepID=UPI00325C1DE9
MDQRRWIESADTFFIGSGHLSGQGRKNDGFDASHRGGRAGFVQVDSLGRLRFPDYAGNNFFNTIGNLLRDSRVALLFVDFPNGNLLHLTGRAEIIWNGDQSPDPGARREVLVTVDQVIERSAVLASRWRVPPSTGTQLEIRDKLRESDDVTSFYLAPPGGEDLVPGKPGQHLAVALDIPELPGRVRRTYSLSGPANGQVYRISVKREPDGIASRFLHDKMKPGDLIETRPPAGAFILPEGPAPLLLISAGVGVTPMLAMLHAAIKDTPHRQVWFLHGTRNGDTHAFRQEVASLAARSDQVQNRVYYSAPLPEDLQRRWHDTHGRITTDDVIALAAGPEADYMICGPTGFTTHLIRGLERSGIALNRIHHETFGPAG